MKRLFLTVGLLLACSFSFAQQYGIKGGFNFGSLTSHGEGYSITSDSRVGLELGFIAEYQLSSNVYFSPELLYIEKGGKDQCISYIQVPFHLTGKYVLNRDISLFVKSGPFAAVGVDAQNGLKFGSNGDLKSMDFGWDFGFGIQSGKLQFGYNYGLGLINISQYGDIKTRVHSLSIAMFF